MTNIALPANIDKDTITIDSVFAEMEHWRKNKSSYPNKSVPDEIWFKCFMLADKYSGKKVRTLFSLNSEQYKKKYKQLVSDHKSYSANQLVKPAARKNCATSHLCEVKIGSSMAADKLKSPPPLATTHLTTKSDLSRLKSTKDEPSDYLDLMTIIVECIRPDGNRLKIHATNKSISEVMSCFYHGDEVQP